MSNNFSKLLKFIASDNGTIIALFLGAALLTLWKSGFHRMVDGVMVMLIFLGSMGLSASASVILFSEVGRKDKYFVYLFFISIAVLIATSLGLFVDKLEKLIIAMGLPGLAVGFMIAFFSARK